MLEMVISAFYGFTSRDDWAPMRHLCVCVCVCVEQYIQMYETFKAAWLTGFIFNADPHPLVVTAGCAVMGKESHNCGRWHGSDAKVFNFCSE